MPVAAAAPQVDDLSAKDALAAGLGPESVAALGGGGVAASRLVALAPPDGTDPRLRRLFDRMIVPCSFARATADMLRAAEAAA
ncbi:MAG: hypothetical protein AAFT19_06345, partial [Pseudomonadota bacterium]